MTILVLGIGNTLLADEGVGIVAMRELETQFGAREDMEFLDGGTLSFTLAVPISECDALLVIDAAELGAAPGTVRSFEGEAMDQFLGENRKSSVHEVGLLDLSVHFAPDRILAGTKRADRHPACFCRLGRNADTCSRRGDAGNMQQSRQTSSDRSQTITYAWNYVNA